MLSYPWSSFAWYLAAQPHRPRWLRTDRLLGAHGIQVDSAEGRQEFERRMEARRQAEPTDAGQRGSLARGWYLGGDDFKRKVLAQMEGLGEHHSGGLKRETAQAKAERIIAEELARLGWTPADLEQRRKGDAGKMALAALAIPEARTVSFITRWMLVSLA